jgi:DNA-binding PadR family transcriptional regulator
MLFDHIVNLFGPRDMDEKQQFLGEFEQMVMLAILQLDEAAYTVPIRNEIAARAGRSVSRGALYTTLERLEQKGGLASELGDPTPIRGGRPKRFWRVTREGLELLRRSRGAMKELSRGLDAVLEEAP